MPTALGGQPALERISLSERGLRTSRRLARPTLFTKGSGPFASKACPALCQQSRPGPLSSQLPRDLLQTAGASHPLERFLNDRRLPSTILERSLNDSRPGSTIPTILERFLNDRLVRINASPTRLERTRGVSSISRVSKSAPTSLPSLNQAGFSA